MKVASPTQNEEHRLQVLDSLNILDTELEETFDGITKLAAFICDVPIALISLVDENRQWFKSRHGLGATETHRDYAFCAHAIHQQAIFEIPDSRKDERFADNPLVTGDPHVIFYAGHPLEVTDNINVGTLCVIDNRPKSLTESQKQMLSILGRQTEKLLQIRLVNRNIKNLIQSKSDLLATMSHEIRTPLNAMIGLIEMMQETSIDEETDDIVNSLNKAGVTLLQLVNDILDYSKLEINKLKLRSDTICLGETIEEAARLFEVNAKEKNIALKWDVEECRSLKVLSDATRLKQVIQNIISNSLKFTEKGYVSISSKLQGSGKTESVVITITDTGIGMSERTKARLFKPYEQGLEHNKGGTGLGLMIVQNIIKLMQGTIDIESKENYGSTFTLSIPIKRVTPDL